MCNNVCYDDINNKKLLVTCDYSVLTLTLYIILFNSIWFSFLRTKMKSSGNERGANLTDESIMTNSFLNNQTISLFY